MSNFLPDQVLLSKSFHSRPGCRQKSLLRNSGVGGGVESLSQSLTDVRFATTAAMVTCCSTWIVDRTERRKKQTMFHHEQDMEWSVELLKTSRQCQDMLLHSEYPETFKTLGKERQNSRKIIDNRRSTNV